MDGTHIMGVRLDILHICTLAPPPYTVHRSNASRVGSRSDVVAEGTEYVLALVPNSNQRMRFSVVVSLTKVKGVYNPLYALVGLEEGLVCACKFSNPIAVSIAAGAGCQEHGMQLAHICSDAQTRGALCLSVH
jgi:hypothetical protein